MNGNAPSFVPRVNFALSSTASANTETHARTRFEQELNNLTYSLESSRLDQGERVPNMRERTYTHRDTIPTVTNEYRDERRQDFYAQTNTYTAYAPPFSLAGLPTRDATFQQINTETKRNINETTTFTTPQNFSHTPDARDTCRYTFTTPWLSYPRKIIRDWKIKFKGSSDSSVEEFLCRIEECRNGTGVTDSNQLEVLSDLLEGMAAKWARLEKHRWQSWNDFVTDFREHYGNPHL